MGIKPGIDGGDFATHADALNWEEWTKRAASMYEGMVTPPVATAAE